LSYTRMSACINLIPDNKYCTVFPFDCQPLFCSGQESVFLENNTLTGEVCRYIINS